ncbi:hypothetical protein [Holdemania filiformis]|uniref:hypothetical protein n=1 Tax=Holdemania filiformis TaxID=61171 RepID=UPI00242EE483|nr:hypothetical protein [Holdemania filiformis]
MGNDLKCVIIDFFGLPGCGKSTISHLLAGRINYRDVFEPSYISDHYWTANKRKIVKAMRTLYVALRFNKVIRGMISIIKANQIEDLHTLISEVINISDKTYSILKKANSDCYIMFDEGIAQAAISLSLNQKRSSLQNYNELLRVIGLRRENILLVYLDEEISTALVRMEKRTSNDSRVEKTNNIELKNSIMKGYLSGAEKLKSRTNIWLQKENENKIDYIYDQVLEFEQKRRPDERENTSCD